MQKLLFSVILSQMFFTAFSIKCYQCNSFNDEGCDTLASHKLTAAYFKECETPLKYNESKPFCRKSEVEIKYPEKSKRTIRSCGWLGPPSPSASLSCFSHEYDGHIEVKCQCLSEGCNGSSQIEMFSILTLSVLNVLVFIAYN